MFPPWGYHPPCGHIILAPGGGAGVGGSARRFPQKYRPRPARSGAFYKARFAGLSECQFWLAERRTAWKAVPPFQCAFSSNRKTALGSGQNGELLPAAKTPPDSSDGEQGQLPGDKGI